MSTTYFIQKINSLRNLNCKDCNGFKFKWLSSSRDVFKFEVRKYKSQSKYANLTNNLAHIIKNT